MDIKCDKGCGGTFTVSQLGLETVRNDIQRTWFYCPHCEKQYTVCYTNTGIRKMQEMVQKEIQKHVSRKRSRLILDLKERIAVGMERLKSEIEG